MQQIINFKDGIGSNWQMKKAHATANQYIGYRQESDCLAASMMFFKKEGESFKQLQKFSHTPSKEDVQAWEAI